MLRVSLASSMAFAAVRAVVSYPLPGLFGTMYRSPVTGPDPPASSLSALVPQAALAAAVANARASVTAAASRCIAYRMIR
jgi:hypothetical protein